MKNLSILSILLTLILALGGSFKFLSNNSFLAQAGTVLSDEDESEEEKEDDEEEEKDEDEDESEEENEDEDKNENEDTDEDFEDIDEDESEDESLDDNDDEDTDDKKVISTVENSDGTTTKTITKTEDDGKMEIKEIIYDASGEKVSELEMKARVREALDTDKKYSKNDYKFELQVKTEDGKLEYKAKGAKAEKLLGLLDVEVPFETTYNPETGELMDEKQTFWQKLLDLLSF